MSDSEKKAQELMLEAEKKLGGGKGMFGSSNKKQEDSIECFQRAANMFKMAKKMPQRMPPNTIRKINKEYRKANGIKSGRISKFPQTELLTKTTRITLTTPTNTTNEEEVSTAKLTLSEETSEKAQELMLEAEKTLGGGKGLSGGCCGSSNKKEEDAIECYQRAANMFKMVKKWGNAGEAFFKAADLHLKNGTKHEAATNFVDAATCYKKCDTKESVTCLNNAIDLYQEMGLFSIAAKHNQTIAEILEGDGDLAQTIVYHKKAADLLKVNEDSPQEDVPLEPKIKLGYGGRHYKTVMAENKKRWLEGGAFGHVPKYCPQDRAKHKERIALQMGKRGPRGKPGYGPRTGHTRAQAGKQGIPLARGSGVESPEFTSPIGSPPDDSLLSAKGKFLELKRMMQQDKKCRQSKRKRGEAEGEGDDEDVEGFELVGSAEDFEREGSISPGSYHDENVEQLLESFRAERGGDRGELSLMSHTRLEHHPKMLEVCQQLRERDQKILTLESKVMELDRQVIDLQDSLSEKEKMLNSKNDAVNCMVTKYQQSIVERDEELSKTQETLSHLERKFGSAQDSWKAEKERLNAEIKQQTQKLKDLDETNKRLEGNRVEQTLKELEWEEKLSVLKEDRNRLTQENVQFQCQEEEFAKEKQQLSLQHEKESEELRSQIEISANNLKEKYEAKFTKMKKQLALKLKTVKESAESQTIFQDLQEQLMQLQNMLRLKVEEVENLTKLFQESNQELNELKSQQLDITDSAKNANVLHDSLLLKLSTLESRIVELEEEMKSLLFVQ